MDQRSDNGRTPLERIKAEHELKRQEILAGYDEVTWSRDISPEQVGLKHVWADEKDQLWVIVRDGDRLLLKRILQHVS